MDDLNSLRRRRDALAKHPYLQKCWVETYRPGGTAGGDVVRYRLRGAKGIVFQGGKRTFYLRSVDVPSIKAQIRRGREISRIDRAIAKMKNTQTSPVRPIGG
jgi:hypothetical protein